MDGYSPYPRRGRASGGKDNFVERRGSCRHNLKIPLHLRAWGGSGPNRDGKSFDISEQGALLETDLPLPVGALLDLRIKLPEEITGQPTTEWRCKSRVVHIALASSVSYPVKVGVHFDWLDVSRR
ncbi:MAG: hypothetical protein DMG38_13420 [Acidobacteria bacterium]|nr:MAG: hypothetical protein DMG38_13420 [Acidobacteriota bacterium]